MGFFSKLFTRTAPGGEKRNLSLTNYQQRVDLGLTTPSAAGVSVSETKALTYATIYTCTRILAETVASMPLIVYERLERGKRRAPEHPLFMLLHDAPNERMTSFEYRETLQGHLALWGNAYSHITYDDRGQVVELFPFRPDRLVQTGTRDGNFWYEFQMPDQSTQWFRQEQIWHLRGLSSDGLFGYSPVRLLRQGIGLGLATEEFGARFFGNGAQLGGVLRHPGVLGDEAHTRLRESWEARHGGLSQAHKVAILEEGMDYESVGIPPEDAQFLETRTFQMRDVARAYRIPLHLVGDLERASFSNIEQQSIEFVSYTMLPWFVRWEQSIKQNLMLPQDRMIYFAEFLADALQRGDIESRYKAYNQAWMMGSMSQNEIRDKENMNPIEGGDVYYVPLNMVSTDESRGAGEQGSRGEELVSSNQQLTHSVERRADEQRQAHIGQRLRLRNVYRPLITEAAGRVFRREANDVANAARRFLKNNDISGFMSWLIGFYESHEEFSARQMLPVLQAYGLLVAPEAAGELAATSDPEETERYMRRYTDAWAARAATRSQNEIDTALAADDVEPALDEVWDRWRNERPNTVGREEAVRAGEAVAGFTWLMAGATAITWRTIGDTCPYCTNLNGRTVGIKVAFLPAGADYQPDGADVPLRPHSNISHAPAHKGCDCYTTAG
jgi:HK97 family phage portal protein